MSRPVKITVLKPFMLDGEMQRPGDGKKAVTVSVTVKLAKALVRRSAAAMASGGQSIAASRERDAPSGD